VEQSRMKMRRSVQMQDNEKDKDEEKDEEGEYQGLAETRLRDN